MLDNGFIPGDDFSCCPDFRDIKLLDEFRDHDCSLLISCSDYNEPTKSRYSKAGGGLYLYDLMSGRAEKKVEGSFRQMAYRDGILHAVDYVACEVQLYSNTFELLGRYPLDAPNYCGLVYNEAKDVFVAINSGKDTVSVHNGSNFDLIDRIHYSGGKELDALSEHHLNDVCTDGTDIFVTYFSHSGYWKKGFLMAA